PLLPPLSHIYVPMPDANRILRAIKVRLPSAYETYQHIMDLLESISGTPTTYNSVRGDINLLINWSWLVAQKDITDLTITDFNRFIDFCNRPPEHLVSKFSASLVDDKKSDDTYIEINSLWRPFVNRNLPHEYKRTESSLKVQLSNLSNLYTFFEDMEYSFKNPAAIALRRLSSNYKNQLKQDRSELNDKALSSLQLSYLLKSVESLAKETPEKYERTRFLIYFLVFCYPRISECSARAGYSPVMGDFEQHRHFKSMKTYFTFYIPFSKGNKSRKVVCSPILIEALIRYRRHLGLSDLPVKDEMTPLFVRHRAPAKGREANKVDANLGSDQIATLVGHAYNHAADILEKDGYPVDAAELRTYTTHNLRHTGISLDINSGRSIRHIMLDAGHASEATLRIYESNRVEYRAESILVKDQYMSDFLTDHVIG
uniref:site-specific integrase n=1 Tax=Candidatus Enterovibrio escicola TaxID=1927127 RepID=UPI00168102DC